MLIVAKVTGLVSKGYFTNSDPIYTPERMGIKEVKQKVAKRRYRVLVGIRLAFLSIGIETPSTLGEIYYYS